MFSPVGISKKSSDNISLNFKQLREEGIKSLQALSGKVWTDYNLHDPGVTTLEILCYALTELGYRTELLQEAFLAEENVETTFIDNYFFSYDELVPSLPLTRSDFEAFIEHNEPHVRTAWLEEYPVLRSSNTIRGGYEVALLLKPDAAFGNLNTDVIQIPVEENDAKLEIIFFDEESRRMPWKNIQKVISCRWNEEDPYNFFIFEDFNFQVALTLEVILKPANSSEKIYVKARGTLTAADTSKKVLKEIDPYRETILQKLESPECIHALTQLLLKEQKKASLLADVYRKLLPCRNLCENFISLRVVNQQEIKIDAEIILNNTAPVADPQMISLVYDHLDNFLFHLVRNAKRPEYKTRKNILYASNLIEEIVKIKGIEAARILNLNLFVDGVPTIPLKDESSFECIHLQRFSQYEPKISREKSTITFIRSGLAEKGIVNALSPKPDTPFATVAQPGKPKNTWREKPNALNQEFLESLRQYYSIQNDFPQNYRLREGQLSDRMPDEIKVRIKQFKAYLTFFERVLIDYLEQLYSFPDLLSVRQRPEASENELDRLKNLLPDLSQLKLIDEKIWEDTSVTAQSVYNQLRRKDKVLDHLLARFATSYTPIGREPLDMRISDKISALEDTLQAKMLLLQDIPMITRMRGLGLPVFPQENGIWNSNLLAGFQKRVYRLLGVNNAALKHVQLTKTDSRKPEGFYLVEHILLIEQEERNTLNAAFREAAQSLYDFFLNLPTYSQQDDPYSFQLTIVLPDWYPSWAERKNTVEAIIKEEVPAHILPHFHWLNKEKLGEFEILYEAWLKALLKSDHT